MKNRIIAIAAILGVLGGLSVGAAQATDYTLAMSEEKHVCQMMLKFANQGLLQGRSLEQPQDFEAPGFAFVQWDQIPRADSFRDHNGAVEGALFDINNDGQLDWVVRMQWAIGGLYRHELLTYQKRSKALFEDDGFARQDEKQADAKLFFYNESYLLTKIPKHKPKKGNSYSYDVLPAFLIPFQFDGVTYILMANPFALQELLPAGRRFAAVVKYPVSFQLQDVCYLEELR